MFHKQFHLIAQFHRLRDVEYHSLKKSLAAVLHVAALVDYPYISILT